MPHSINPLTQDAVTTYVYTSPEKVQDTIKKLHDSYRTWSAYSFEKRAAVLHAIRSNLLAHKEECAQMICAEMGKPITQARAEIDKCALTCEYYASNTHLFLEPEHIKTEYTATYVRFDPLGIIFTITPWNFPFWMVFRTAAASLMAGNTVLLKGASLVPGCTALIERICATASLDLRLLAAIYTKPADSESIIKDPRIAAVALTGSETAGSQVAALAGAYLKKCVLELGGSDPFIVFPDADIQRAAAAAAAARCANAGQICISPKRYLVHQDVADAFLDALTRAVTQIVVGDPTLDTTHTGPLARDTFVTDVDAQVTSSIQKGARIHFQKDMAHLQKTYPRGAWYPPTILSHVSPGMPAYDEEIFGPVYSVILISSDEEALQVANATRFGLGANIWTKDIKKAEEIASRLIAGSVAINDIVKSDPRYPLGGTKASGYGRELGKEGIREWVTAKSIVVA